MTIVNKEQWDSFLSEHQNTHILQSGEWGEFKSEFGWEIVRVVNNGSGSQILFKKLPLVASWAYIPKGPIGNDWNELWPLIEKECKKRKAVFLKVEPDIWMDGHEISAEKLSAKSFVVSNHQIQPSRTLIVDLLPAEDEILSRMKQKTRYNINLAKRKGVNILKSGDVRRFYDLVKITSERENFNVHSLDYYRRAYEIFSKIDCCELFLAVYQGKLLAAIMVFSFGQRAWYFYGASSNQYRNLMAPYAVQWEAMQWARRKGCVEYDLWGVPDEEYHVLEDEFLNRNDGLWGVYRFKRGFGGKLSRSIGAWDRIFNPILYSPYYWWTTRGTDETN
jgi:lipid II:glycine glycyltransferase (peptidoglycan interpeptide bridge formation enzyme)